MLRKELVSCSAEALPNTWWDIKIGRRSIGGGANLFGYTNGWDGGSYVVNPEDGPKLIEFATSPENGTTYATLTSSYDPNKLFFYNKKNKIMD